MHDIWLFREVMIARLEFMQIMAKHFQRLAIFVIITAGLAVYSGCTTSSNPKPPAGDASVGKTALDGFGYVGTWRRINTETGETFDFVILPDGTARNTITPQAISHWQPVDGAIVMAWDTGWFNRISPGSHDREVVLESWRPGDDRAGRPYGRSTLVRVEE
jgi:hypothetical protein